jgi:hypothetical protein
VDVGVRGAEGTGGVGDVGTEAEDAEGGARVVGGAEVVAPGVLLLLAGTAVVGPVGGTTTAAVAEAPLLPITLKIILGTKLRVLLIIILALLLMPTPEDEVLDVVLAAGAEGVATATERGEAVAEEVAEDGVVAAGDASLADEDAASEEEPVVDTGNV